MGLADRDPHDLLTEYPDIERQHFKLRLISAIVLERYLTPGIFGDTEAYLDRIRLCLSRYVPNPSFERAQKLLDKAQFCIVVGIPDIRKTTLAEVLLADLDRRGEQTATLRQHVAHHDDLGLFGRVSCRVSAGCGSVGVCEAWSDKGSSVNAVWRHSLNADYPPMIPETIPMATLCAPITRILPATEAI